jgi:peptide/nickel transport system permease protein
MMLRLLARRVLYIALVLVLIVFVVHLGMRAALGPPASLTGRDGLARYGQLAWQDTMKALERAARGDLGSVRTGAGLVPIAGIVGEAYVNSMGLLLAALVFATIGGLLIGIVAAVATSGVPSLQRVLAQGLLGLTLIGISTPAFFMALLLQVGELRYLALFGRRLVHMAGFGWDLKHMLMPVLVLAARPLAYLTRATFLSLRQVLLEDYMRTAYAKGLSQPRALFGHAARNVAVPVLTAVGVAVRFSLSTLPVVEFFFAWPGIGRRLLEAIGAHQVSVVVALASALGLTFLLANLILDVAYRLLDPRVRARSEAEKEGRA